MDTISIDVVTINLPKGEAEYVAPEGATFDQCMKTITDRWPDFTSLVVIVLPKKDAG